MAAVVVFFMRYACPGFSFYFFRQAVRKKKPPHAAGHGAAEPKLLE
jgi:hypothetical protein